MNVEQRLLKLKRRVGEKQEAHLRAQGQLDSLLRRLKKDFGFNSIEKAQKRKNSWSKKVEILKEEMEKKIRDLEASF